MFRRIAVEAAEALVEVAQRSFEHVAARLSNGRTRVADAVLGHERRERGASVAGRVRRGQLVLVRGSPRRVRRARRAAPPPRCQCGPCRCGVEQQRCAVRVGCPFEDDPQLGRDPVEQVDVDGREQFVVGHRERRRSRSAPRWCGARHSPPATYVRAVRHLREAGSGGSRVADRCGDRRRRGCRARRSSRDRRRSVHQLVERNTQPKRTRVRSSTR